jgi:hypothetical protein
MRAGMPHPNENLIATAAMRRRRSKWFKKKRRVWPKYLLLALFVAICFVTIVYIIGENLALR